MAIIVLLISISLVIAIGFLLSFLWNMKSGQYDDTYSPSVRMLFENKPKEEVINTKHHGNHADTNHPAEKI
jgi:cbb3-type cytochrome oxidase maturation protein